MRAGLVFGFAALLLWRAAAAESLQPVTPEAVGLSSEGLARIGWVMQAGVDAGEIPGAVVLVARRGGVAYHQAFGFRDRATGEAMPRDAIFRIYSMTKPIVSVAAMTLHEEGRLYLAQPIATHLPAFAEMEVGVERFEPATGRRTFHTEPAARAITVHDLLRHTSGLTYAFIGAGAVKDLYEEAGLSGFELDMSIATYAERLAELPLLWQPGRVWDYGRSADVLGALIEAVAETPLDAFLEARVLAPLGMRDSGFWVPESERHRIAAPQADAAGAIDDLIDVSRPPRMFAGGHGMVSTAMDYARFCQMILDRGSLDGVRVLGPETVAYMTADHLGDAISRDGTRYLPGPGYGFGLGFAVRTAAGQSPWPGSLGEVFWGGYAGTYFWIDPALELVVVHMMQSIGQRSHYRMLLRTLVSQAIIN